MQFKLTQSSFDYDLDTGEPVNLRIILPSEPCGRWDGNNYEIRKWTIGRIGSYVFSSCTDEEVIAFEKFLFDQNVKFVEHSGLGRVATPCL